MKRVEIKIDGKTVNAKKNETVLEAAGRAGIKIPTLCYHHELEPYGGCRLCIVEVKGIKNPLTACTLPVKTGMEIKTISPKLNALRRFTLQLILSEHPQSCLICQKKDECGDYQRCIEKVSITTGCKFCPKNSRCELQDVIEEIGLKEVNFGFEYRNQEIERFDPFFDRDYNLCILCGRCTRACQDLRRAATLDFHHRGPRTLVGTAFGLSHLETNCQFCGACVDVCPTGALADRFSRWQGIPERSAMTTCIICNIACSIKANIKKDEIIGIEPNSDQLCVRGRFGIAPMVQHPMRAIYPFVKADNRLKRVQWQHAFDQAASELIKHKGRTGIIFSPQITVEAIDKLIIMAAGLNAILVPSVNVSGYRNFKIKSIARNACFIVINTDLIGDFSPMLIQLRKQAPDARVIVIDSMKSDFADNADVFIRVGPGTESEALKEIMQKKSGKLRFIDKNKWSDCQNLTAGRKVYLIYNPANMIDFKPIAALTLIPIFTAPNAAYLSKFELSNIRDLLDDKSIDCLYIIGRTPHLNREYKSIISQDCFISDARVNVFLPAAAFTEIQGSIIGYDGKVKRLKQLVPSKGESQSDVAITDALITKLSIKSTAVKKQKLRKAKVSGSRQEITGNNNWHLIVRESGYAYRNTRFSSLHKGFDRIRGDQYMHINPADARQLKIKEGGRIRVVGSDIILEGAVKLSDNILLKSILVQNSGVFAGLYSQMVRLECIK